MSANSTSSDTWINKITESLAFRKILEGGVPVHRCATLRLSRTKSNACGCRILSHKNRPISHLRSLLRLQWKHQFAFGFSRKAHESICIYESSSWNPKVSADTIASAIAPDGRSHWVSKSVKLAESSCTNKLCDRRSLIRPCSEILATVSVYCSKAKTCLIMPVGYNMSLLCQSEVLAIHVWNRDFTRRLLNLNSNFESSASRYSGSSP